MKRGQKPLPASVKQDRGTYQPCKDGHKLDLIEPGSIPQRPDWLTPEGEEIWGDNVARVSAINFADERDSTEFGNYCNLQGRIIRCWREGEFPPVAALTEARRKAEMFGIAGGKSRLEGAAPPKKVNKFADL